MSVIKTYQDAANIDLSYFDALYSDVESIYSKKIKKAATTIYSNVHAISDILDACKTVYRDLNSIACYDVVVGDITMVEEKCFEHVYEQTDGRSVFEIVSCQMLSDALNELRKISSYIQKGKRYSENDDVVMQIIVPHHLFIDKLNVK